MGIFVALEYLNGWGRDILDEDVIGDLAGPLSEHLKTHQAVMQFIRKPGRAGQFREYRKLYIADTTTGTCYVTEVKEPADLLDINISAVASAGKDDSNYQFRLVDHPIMLVCTHGKRDQCCALKGRPIAAAMQACFYGDEVWETSHSGGHRFAPTMILLPWGYSYGRLTSGQAIEAVKAGIKGQLYLPGNRGRGCFDNPGQVAELAVAAELEQSGEKVQVGSLAVQRVTDDPTRSTAIRRVIALDGRQWEVNLSQEDLGMTLASCGKEPKPAKQWLAHTVTPV